MASLARAIESLGAVDLGEGRYAYKTCAGWRILDGPANVALALDLYENARGYTGRAMPFWWAPEQRFAWRLNDAECATYGPWTDSAKAKRATSLDDMRAQLRGTYIDERHMERVTADLATGEEVPADAPAR